MSPESQRKETDAFLSFFGTFELPHPAATVAELSDGAALLHVLTLVSVPSSQEPRPRPSHLMI